MSNETPGSPATRIDVLWKLVEGEGLEHCRMLFTPDENTITGTVVTSVEDAPATIQYAVQCDRYWHTREVVVELLSRDSEEPKRLRLLSDGDGNWLRVTETVNGPVTSPVSQITGCIDIDLSFTPATNSIPLHRYTLVHGAKVKVTAAWVLFPSLEIETLPQQYTRLERPYVRYQSFRDGFTTDLDVDTQGVVVTYPGLWERLTASVQQIP